MSLLHDNAHYVVHGLDLIGADLGMKFCITAGLKVRQIRKNSTCNVGLASVGTSIGILPITWDVFEPMDGLDMRCHAHSLEFGKAGGLATLGIRHLKLLLR